MPYKFMKDDVVEVHSSLVQDLLWVQGLKYEQSFSKTKFWIILESNFHSYISIQNPPWKGTHWTYLKGMFRFGTLYDNNVMKRRRISLEWKRI